MAAREKGGRVVFIGNIPYGVSEEQICEIFGRVGSVVNFRLVYDKETARPKGFGFLEYTDVDAAASAVRNLNDFEIMGRTLRVDYSNDNGGGKKSGGGGGQDGGDMGGGNGRAPLPQGHFESVAPPAARVDPGALPPLPPGMPLKDGLTAPDAISQTLKALPPAQLLDIISQMKNLSMVNPAQASTLLSQAPQLGYAIFQALLNLGLVDTTLLVGLVNGQPPPVSAQQQAPPPQQQQQQQMQYPPPPTHQQPMPMPPQQQPMYSQPPPQQYAPPAPQQQQQYYSQPPPQQQYAPTPQQVQQPYQPPPPPQQNELIARALAGVAPEQQAVLKQVLEMPREAIFALDEGARNQILMVRQQFGVPV